MNRTLLGAAILVLASTTATATAQTQATVRCDRDNTLYQEALPMFQRSNGSGTRIFVGYTFQPQFRRALVHFDVASAVPRGSTITAVTFTANEARGRGFPRAVGLHRMTSDWGEGASVATGQQGDGAPAAPGDATWLNSFHPNTQWQTPGGDFVATASSSVQYQMGTLTIPSTAALVADVQGWLDNPSQNFGWMIKSDEANLGDATAFHSRESQFGPSISVTYMPPSAAAMPFGSGCTGSGSTALTLTNNGLPQVGNASFGIAVTGGPSGIVAENVLVSLLPLSGGLPLGGGCSAYINPLGFLDGVPLPPSRSLTIAVPNQPSLIGGELTMQSVGVDGGALVASNGLELRVGT